MDFALHPGAVEAFNRRAAELLDSAKLTSAMVEGSARRSVLTGSAAHLPIAAHISNPENLVRRSSDPLTNELLEVAFVAGSKRVTLAGSTAGQFTRLAFDVVSRRELRDTCSHEFVEQSLTDWMRDRVSGAATSSWTDAFLARLAASVNTYTFRVPLVGIVAGAPFTIGPYRVSFITAAEVEELASGSPDDIRAELKQKHTKLYQGKCCVEGEVTAEPSKAADLALDAGEDVVRALRFVHPAAFDIAARCEIGLLDRVLSPGWHVILRKGTGKPRISRGVEFGGDVPFAYSARDQELLGQLGLNAASRFLGRSDSSSLHTKAWSALSIFTRGLELGTWRDKLIHALVAAETLLLRSETEPIQHSLGLRMARLVCDSVTDRKKLISELHFAYRARSAFIHHGRDSFGPEGRRQLTSVLIACRQVVHNCLQSDDATAEALVGKLDDQNLA